MSNQQKNTTRQKSRGQANGFFTSRFNAGIKFVIACIKSGAIVNESNIIKWLKALCIITVLVVPRDTGKSRSEEEPAFEQEEAEVRVSMVCYNDSQSLVNELKSLRPEKRRSVLTKSPK